VSEADRNAILRRRAALVGSALAALGSCARTSPPPDHAAAPVIAVPPPAVEDGGVTAEPDGGDLPSRRENHAGEPPPLIVPAGVGDTARAHYEQLVRTYSDAYKILDQMEAGIANGCSINDAKCESQWRALAENEFSLTEAFRFFHVCPGSSQDAKDFNELEKAHRDYYTERLKKVHSAIEAQIDAGGPGSDKKWEQMKRDVRLHKPVVCLSFACIDW